VIDAGGLLGQIIAVTPTTATVLLLTDPDHAVPVAVARSGVRLVAYGRGDRLEIANVPLSSDVKVGDSLVTSGLGGRFPAGFPVGTIRTLRPDDSRAFLVGALAPAAQLDRGRDVLLLRHVEVKKGAGDSGLGTDAQVVTGARAGDAPPGAGANVPATTSPAQATPRRPRPTPNPQPPTPGSPR
jgi:rod shape-determining protein MreC